MGDDVQAIKAGIMEIADVFVLNKADQPGVDRLEREIEAMLGLNPSGRRPPIIRVVATEGAGIDTALRLMHEVRERRSQTPRVELWRTRLLGMLRDRVMQVFPADEVQRAAEQVAARASDPYVIVEEWLRRYLSLQPEGRSNQDRT
jgi:LAO/AO transport system kinase